ncbi:NifU family protein [Modestobacter marinus]|uniref:NifU family protein n=1 Tax=Modestobacter marinus TaxID=477641 RepID=UPI001C96D8E0|nr:NifU family protein [Modestobacter marinus]
MTAADRAPPEGGELDLGATGERIEALLEAAAAGGRVARERAEELVRLVADLYGAGLERLLGILHDTGRLDDDLLDRLAADELVAGLLTVHGLHPEDVGTRVLRALDGVRPYLGSHGGDVELLGVTGDGVVRLRMLGSCDGCPSSAVTLTLAVETAVRAAAPEVTGIAVEEAPAAGTVIPLAALRARLDGDHPSAEASWTAVDGLGDLAPGQLGAFSVAGIPVVGARIAGDLYAYRDRCPRCGGSLAGGLVERRLGGSAGDAVLRCPACAAHYDVRRAGRGLDGTADHLEPVPLLVTDGGVALAVPAGAGT